ncbi:MAG: hypothetical protein ACR5LD_03075 [Symbiopectobacterium sp.]
MAGCVAESDALSTDEAIGTGMSILVMVVQSWEDESKRLLGKDITPCRLLFLDEAACLDAKSIATLFELCERLEMQLVIAAPENISPEKGTTYKLVRKCSRIRSMCTWSDCAVLAVRMKRRRCRQERLRYDVQKLCQTCLKPSCSTTTVIPAKAGILCRRNAFILSEISDFRRG